MSPEPTLDIEKTPRLSKKRIAVILGVIVLIIAAAIVRSAITTSLDGFTYDEAYHIGAGVSYVKTRDFRLNPEHPPLTKLWTGAYLSLFEYNLTPFRPLTDKVDERGFIEEDVYNNNDPDLIQSRARTAMFALNGLLLLIFSIAIWRVFNSVVAVAAAAFLAIDPTVAAHLPVVMTDLPVALTAGTALLLSVHAFRTWRPFDLAIAAVALGLALSSKHSAVIVVVAVFIIGAAMALFPPSATNLLGKLRRAGAVAAVVAGAVVVLWGFYLFSYYESPETREDQFNRPLAEKIKDVKSPVYRFGLNLMTDGYLFPRAYVWGLADTIRAGAEGRVGTPFVFGKLYYGKAPWFYAPGTIAVKLPLGLLLLTVLGSLSLALRKTPREFLAPILGLVVFSVIFLFFLIRGSSYGGIRHILPVYPLLAVLASAGVYVAAASRSKALGAVMAISVVAAMVSAVPVMRPWEYFNELVGGTANGHRYFDDEGVDLYQRYKEGVRYYHGELAPAGEIPYVFYFLPSFKDPKRNIDYRSRRNERDKGTWDGPYETGTFIIGANEISPAFWWDKASFRDAEPIRRFGNLLVFRGTFDIRPMLAQGLAHRASFEIYGPEPNLEKAIEMLSESAALDAKAFFVSLELGNLYLKLGNREESLKAYEAALENIPENDPASEELKAQVQRLKSDPLEKISPLRNPSLE